MSSFAPRAQGSRRRPASAPIATAAQFQRDMESVQQYIRQHAQLDDRDAAALLGVGDARSRQCYDEIQAFLLRKLQLEQARSMQVATPANGAIQTSDGRFLLRDLDDYLDELDPALFDGATATPRSPAAYCGIASALNVPPAASYIRRAQEDAKMPQLQQSTSFQQPRASHALKRVHSL